MQPPLPLAIVLLALALGPAPAQAHPHVFVDVTHQLLFDAAGRLVGLRARWAYDEMFTLLMVEDGKYDINADGEISGAELEAFQRWDANWPADYTGDVEITLEGVPVALQGPSDWAAEWHAGRAVSLHTRRLQTPLDLRGKRLSIRPYDKDFYVDYTVKALPGFIGRADCRAEILRHGEDAVSPETAAKIAALPAEMTPAEAGLPAIGGLYADEERVRCGN